MKNFFNVEGPFIRITSRVADILWINVLTILCSLPVITAGAALTSMNYLLIQIVKGEESYITRTFFRQFMRNIKKATLMWLVFIALMIIFAGDIYFIYNSKDNLPAILCIIPIAIGIWFFAISIYAFGLMAWFENSVLQTMKNAALLSFAYLPRTVLMLLVWGIVILILFFIPQLQALVLLFGISGPALICVYIYIPVWDRLASQSH